MDEFEKIKTFSESLAEREQNMAENKQETEKANLDLPKYLSQFRAVPVQEEKESKSVIWLVLILCGFIAAGTIFALSQRFSKIEESEIIVISPTPTPVKVLPENPGGLNIPDRDKVVFNRNNQENEQIAVENLFPEAEQPVLPVEVIEPENKEEEIISPVFSSEVVESTQREEKSEEPILIEDQSDDTVVPIDIPLIEEELVEKEQETAEIKVQPIEAPVTDKIEEIEPKEVEKKVSNKVVWRAQLLSSSSKTKVESSWKQISQKQKALLSDMPYQIISATIPGKGTFWRLQVGEFATKEMVVNLCAKLKKKKQECIPVK